MKRIYLLVFSIALAGLLAVTGCIAPRPAPYPYPQPRGGGPEQGAPGIPPEPYYSPYGPGSGGMMGPGGMGGGGMMGGGMMGRGMMGGGMMGGSGGPGAPTAPYGAQGLPITLDGAIAIAQQYLVSLPYPHLALDKVEEYANNFYARYKEKSSGIFAMELLIDKPTGRIFPQPSMMWNIKYNPMAAPGETSQAVSAALNISAQQARDLAHSFLSNYLPGATTGQADAFYGYYTLSVRKEGQNLGMLSVHGYSGQVWYHTWHGAFMQEKEAS